MTGNYAFLATDHVSIQCHVQGGPKQPFSATLNVLYTLYMATRNCCE